MPMGGRGVWDRKTKVNEVRSIDILDLQRKGAFNGGGSVGKWTSSWSRNGEVVASVSYWVTSDRGGPTGLRFMFSITDKDTCDQKAYDYIVSVTATLCNYGGKRWWFTCPLMVNGHGCQRRSRIIYMSPGAECFGCRECHRSTYESRQRHREKFYEDFEKPFKAVEAAQDKLARTRSEKKKEWIFQKLRRAHAVIKGFEGMFQS